MVNTLQPLEKLVNEASPDPAVAAVAAEAVHWCSPVVLAAAVAVPVVKEELAVQAVKVAADRSASSSPHQPTSQSKTTTSKPAWAATAVPADRAATVEVAAMADQAVPDSEARAPAVTEAMAETVAWADQAAVVAAVHPLRSSKTPTARPHALPTASHSAIRGEAVTV